MGLTPGSFERLLASLGSDRESAGEHYVRIRRKLVKFFEWRGCECPEDLADRTIDRVGRRIEEGEEIRAQDPSAYFYGVARNILRESWNDQMRNREIFKQAEVAGQSASADRSVLEGDAGSDRRLTCLERCLERLPVESRDLLLRYYEGEKGEKIANRQDLADRWGISVVALRLRVCRLRERLEGCVRECMEAGQSDIDPDFSHRGVRERDH